MKTLTRKVWTDAALMAIPKERGRFELIDGKLTRMSPAGSEHGYVGVRIASAIHKYVAARRSGLVYDSSTGFRLDPENVLSPDVSYASRESVQKSNTRPGEFFRGTPELAVEVISPSERRGKIRLKVEKYFACGTRLVWLVYPLKKRVDIYTSPDEMISKEANEALDGGEVLPGFRLPLDEIFAEWF